MIRVAVIGLGKMGISHLAIAKAHPSVNLVAVCDSHAYLLDTLEKYTFVKTYTDHEKLLASEKLDAVIIATPSRLHAHLVRAALDANVDIFCEKPFCLDAAEGLRLTDLAERKELVNQVGYHNRFVGIFHEVKRLLDLNILGRLHHVRAEAYGPVILRSKGVTWRAKKSEGGGCLFDYASHTIDLVNYFVGRPEAVGGTVLNRLFSSDVEDEVYSSLYFPNGMTGQLAANWSDESYRRMSTKITIWGTNGKIIADRQELQVFLRNDAPIPEGFNAGWNVRYTTDVTEEVGFYLRGEEYSAQINHFIQAVEMRQLETRSTFRSATDADLVACAMVRDADQANVRVSTALEAGQTPEKKSWWNSPMRLWPTTTRPSR